MSRLELGAPGTPDGVRFRAAADLAVIGDAKRRADADIEVEPRAEHGDVAGDRRAEYRKIRAVGEAVSGRQSILPSDLKSARASFAPQVSHCSGPADHLKADQRPTNPL